MQEEITSPFTFPAFQLQDKPLLRPKEHLQLKNSVFISCHSPITPGCSCYFYIKSYFAPKPELRNTANAPKLRVLSGGCRQPCLRGRDSGCLWQPLDKGTPVPGRQLRAGGYRPALGGGSKSGHGAGQFRAISASTTAHHSAFDEWNGMLLTS